MSLRCSCPPSTLRRHPSARLLTEYLLLSIEAVHADLFRRGAEGLWVLHQFGPDDDLELESIDFRVSMAELYRGVEVVRPAHI